MKFFGIMAELSETKSPDSKIKGKEMSPMEIIEEMYKMKLIVVWEGSRYWSNASQITEISDYKFSMFDEFGLSIFGLILLLDLERSRYISNEKINAYGFNQSLNLENEEERTEILNAFQKNEPEYYKLMKETTTEDEKEFIKEINILIRQNSHLLPQVFSYNKWKVLSTEFSKIEVILALILQYFEPIQPNTNDSHDQIKDLFLISSQKQMSDIMRERLDRFYKKGLTRIQDLIEHEECKIPIKIRNPLGISSVAKLITENIREFDELKEYDFINSETEKNETVNEKDFNVIKKLHKPLKELIKIEKKLGRKDSIKNESHFAFKYDFRKRIQIISLTNVISFQFYTRLRMMFPNKWERIMKQVGLFDWYIKWEKDVKDFYKLYNM